MHQLGIANLGLFGSFARNENNEDSDIDILVSFQQHTSGIREKKQFIKEALEQEFGKSVDVCNEKYIKPFYRKALLDQAIYI